MEVLPSMVPAVCGCRCGLRDSPFELEHDSFDVVFFIELVVFIKDFEMIRQQIPGIIYIDIFLLPELFLITSMLAFRRSHRDSGCLQ